MMVYVSANYEHILCARSWADLQIPTTSEQIAKPVMVFFSRYGARARSNAGEARMRAS